MDVGRKKISWVEECLESLGLHLAMRLLGDTEAINKTEG